MIENRLSDCAICRSNSGAERISPGPVVHKGEFWLVEHAYPTSLLGWLVIVLRRHAEAVHELTSQEAAELAELQVTVAAAVHAVVGCEKEYLACFAEATGFHHLHVHVIPRAAMLPIDMRGAAVFKHLRPAPDETLSAAEIARICGEIQEWLSRSSQVEARPRT